MEIYIMEQFIDFIYIIFSWTQIQLYVHSIILMKGRDIKFTWEITSIHTVLNKDMQVIETLATWTD